MEAPTKEPFPEQANAKLLELMSLSAWLILENGGETYRVEETVRHMGKKEGCTVEIIALPTAIFIMLETPEGQQAAALPLSPGGGQGRRHMFLQSIRSRTVNLGKIDRVNAISRRFCSGRLTLDQALEGLREVDCPPKDEKLRLLVCWSLAAGFFALLFGGGWFDFLMAACSGALVTLALQYAPSLASSYFISSLITGFVTTSIAVLAPRWAGVGNTNSIVVGGIMPFLPGLALTNSFRDTMAGDLVSGGARLGETLVRAAALAFGAGAALAVLSAL